MRIELSVERNTAYLSGFPSVKNITFVQNASNQVNRSSISLGRKPYMLEAGGSHKLISLRIELACERNT
jgi:hypothetical protein